MFRQKLLSAILVGLTAASAACGATQATTSETETAPTGRRDPSTITGDDIRKLDVANLYDVVQRLHPEWLTGHNANGTSGRGTANEVQVFIDSQRAGATDILRQLTPTSALSLRHFSASEAQARFGNGNLNGVIQVVMVANR